MSSNPWLPALELPVTAPAAQPAPRWRFQPRWRKAAIFGAIVALALVHCLAPRHDRQVHDILYHLTVIPMLCAGMLCGFRLAGWAMLLMVSLEIPLIWLLWAHDPVYALDQTAEIAIFGVTGLVAGFLSDRERAHAAKLQRTSAELAHVYAELQQNVDRLKKAERLSAVAELSASLAHEIRNPLAGISGAAGILKRGSGGTRNAQECVEIIEKESQRLNKLLTGFLDFARPRAPRFQRTDLEAVIDAVVALAARTPEAIGIEFQREIQPRMPEVECDPEQLKQVLLNLVLNAVQATGKGIVRMAAMARDGKACVAVIDQGAGIPPEQQERMFEPFFTTKENGTGLGLAVALKIVEQHSGTLTARSAPSGGLMMVVELPLARARTS